METEKQEELDIEKFSIMNPTLREYLRRYPDKSILGFSWSIGWRFFLMAIVARLIFRWVLGVPFFF